MGAAKGNQYAKGSKGGTGRPSVKDTQWHQDKWELDSNVPALQEKLKTGKYSVRDVFLAKALQGNERVLSIFANKLLADLVDVTTNGQSLPSPILGYVSKNDSVGESPETDEENTNPTGGNVGVEDDFCPPLPDESRAI